MKQQKLSSNEGVNKKSWGAHPESDFRRRVATKNKLPSLYVGKSNVCVLMHRRPGDAAGGFRQAALNKIINYVRTHSSARVCIHGKTLISSF